jgi:hypothetical protein
MPAATLTNPLALTANRLPPVTAKDVGHFYAVDIRDAEAFADELQAFLHDRLKAAGFTLPRSARPASGTLERTLARKAATLRAQTRWAPSPTDIQRGRVVLLQAFNQPHNLPLREFAGLANKSRQQIYKDIHARRLLALNAGGRGQKLPDWQLDPVKQRLTQAVLQAATGDDPWTLYHALSEPLEVLKGRSPVDAVTAGAVEAVAKAVLGALGVQGRPARRA